MPSQTFPWAWVWVVLWAGVTANITDLTPPSHPPQNALPSPPQSGVTGGGVKGGPGGLCSRGAPRHSAPQVELTWERQTAQVIVFCHSKLPTLFPFHPTHPTDPPTPPPATPPPTIATLGAGGRGVILNLTQLEQEGDGVQVVVDVEGCGCVGVQAGVPAWVEGVTFAIKGSLELPDTWYEDVGGSGSGVREMWVRVNEGVAVVGETEERGACHYVPPTVETLDLSYTPVGELMLVGDCAPRYIERLEAMESALTEISLCTPTLKTLYVKNNEMGGDMEWAGCEGGVKGVTHLYANDNRLSSLSTCSWPALNVLEVRSNWLTALDVVTCPPANLTTLSAARNFLTSAPSPLPRSLTSLDLSYNNISALPVIPSSLKDADFSYNSLQEVGQERFLKARRLHHLNLAHNHITEIKGNKDEVLAAPCLSAHLRVMSRR